MKSRVVIFLFLAMSIGNFVYADQSSSPTNLLPTGIPGPAPAAFASLLPSSFAPAGFSLGSVVVNPYVQIGYQINAVNMGVPINVEFDPDQANPNAHLILGTQDVVLRDYNFWMGTVGMNAILSPTLTVFGSASGFLPHSFIEKGILPISLDNLGAQFETTMTGIDFESWTIQCGVSVGIGGGYSVLAGSLWQYTIMVYEDPRSGSRTPNPTMRQDFLLKNWAPYIGFQFLQIGYYRAAFVYSPLLTSSGAISSRTTTPIMSDLSYNLNQPGYMASFTGEYFLPLQPPTTFSIWFNGAISSLKGSSDVIFTAGNIHRSGVVSDLTLNQYSLGGGVTLGLIF
ncbi:MAG: hypothetical protein NTY51_01115 [Deltaproteobacteria bacterium]|nr:hypothetical protein [Deltaproteobacteria bacterium]